MSGDGRSGRPEVTREGLQRKSDDTATGPGAVSPVSAADLDSDLPEGVAEAVAAIEGQKGEEMLVLDLRELASFTDVMVICNGRSERHVQALTRRISERLEEAGVEPLHTEGYEQASWVLIDFVDFLVNVFTPETRDYYQLERVWRDAPVLAGRRRSGADAAGSASGETG